MLPNEAMIFVAILDVFKIRKRETILRISPIVLISDKGK